MRLRLCRRTGLLLALAAWLPRPGRAAPDAAPASPGAVRPYPAGPVRVLVAFPPGGPTDITARVIAAGLERRFGQPFLLENLAGEAGAIAHRAAAAAAPDGYTLLVSAAGPLVVSPHARSWLGPDARAAFAPVRLVSAAPLVLLVRPSLPANTLAELLAYARASPQGLAYGSFGVGSISHLAAEMFHVATGAPLVHAPFDGAAPALDALAGEGIDLVFEPLGGALPRLENGEVRAIGIAAASRSPFLPWVPTLAEAGLPGFEAGTWFALLAPRGTPPGIIAELDLALDGVLAEPGIAAAMEAQGLTPLGGSAGSLAAFLSAEHARWGQAARTAGLAPP